METEKLAEERALHQEVVRFLVAEVADLVRARDRALACEAAARGLLAALSSPPSPTSAPGIPENCPVCCSPEKWAGMPHHPACDKRPPPEVERGKCGECGECGGTGVLTSGITYGLERPCTKCGTGREGTNG
jgi:hypothetical protein